VNSSNTDENLRLFFGDDRSKGASFEDYTQAIHPDDREFVIQRHAQLLAEGGPREIEYRVVWPDGNVHVLLAVATVVRDELGQAIRTYGTNLDITERKQAEDKLQLAYQSLSYHVENTPLAVIEFDKDLVLNDGQNVQKKSSAGSVRGTRKKIYTMMTFASFIKKTYPL